MFGSHLQTCTFVGTVVPYLIHQVTGMAPAHRTICAPIVLLQQVVDHFRLILATDRLSKHFEKRMKLLFVGIGDLDLIGNPSQEGFVDKIFGLEIRGEDNELFEGNLDFLAGSERDEIDSVLQGNDPPIEELGRSRPLASKVINEQATAVALHLQWSFTHVRSRIVPDFQVIHCEFAAYDDRGSADFDPATIVILNLDQAIALGADFTVVGRIEEFDQLSAFGDGVGYPDFLAKADSDSPGQGGLSIPRGSVQKHTGAGIDRRTEDFEQVRMDRNIMECFFQCLASW